MARTQFRSPHGVRLGLSYGSDEYRRNGEVGEKGEDMLYFATLGRVLMGLFFLTAAWDMYVGDHTMIMQRMMELHVPMLRDAYTASIVLQVVGGVALMAGFGTRIVALLLAASLIAISYYLHNFWGVPALVPTWATPEHGTEIIPWVRTLAIVGGLFAFVSFGSGPLSVDNGGGIGWMRPGRRKTVERGEQVRA
jgi:putative oxidoreductase